MVVKLGKLAHKFATTILPCFSGSWRPGPAPVPKGLIPLLTHVLYNPRAEDFIEAQEGTSPHTPRKDCGAQRAWPQKLFMPRPSPFRPELFKDSLTDHTVPSFLHLERDGRLATFGFYRLLPGPFLGR